ncbi:MAG: mechanosensitive ion channel family protein [Blastocatellia bacterium]
MLLRLVQSTAQRQTGSVGIVWQTLLNLWHSLLARLPYLVIGLIVITAFVITARIVRRIIHTAGERTRLDVTLADLLGRLAWLGIIILGVFVAAVVVFPAFKPGDLVAGLGITSVAIGFAFKDILQNFFAGILILWRRPFRIGDEIRTKDFEGTVEDINTRSTWLKTYDGERVIVPNSDVYTSPIMVRTAFHKRRLKFVVGIGYPDSIEQARATIEQVLEQTEGVMKDPGPWVYVSELAPSSVNFTVWFWTEPEQAKALAAANRVATGIKLALDKAGIDMPYPHEVVLFHDTTGSRQGDIERETYLHQSNGAAPQTMRQGK